MAMKVSLYTLRLMQLVRRLKSIPAFNTVTLKPLNYRQSPRERKPTSVLQIEFPTAMTDRELNKRAEATRINLSLWRAQSDIALHQNQREANQAQLQAAVQEQLRPRSGNIQLTITSSFG